MDQAYALPKPHEYQARNIRWFNTLHRTLRAAGLKRHHFYEGPLMDAATRITKLDDFGDERFRDALRYRLGHLRATDGFYSETGRRNIEIGIVTHLVHRLMAQAHFKRFPEILERRIVAPIIILGLPRTGTTRLQRMMASDARLLHLKYWECCYPVPWPACYEARDNGTVDPRVPMTDSRIDYMLKLNNNINSIHPLSTHEPDEEMQLVAQSFFVESMGEVCEDRDDLTHAYEHLAKLLKLISFFRNDAPNKRWILKSPQHTRCIATLMRVFPDAKLIFTHRDPIKAIGSLCSLSWNFACLVSDRPQAMFFGPGCLATADEAMKEMMLKRPTVVPADQQLDVYYNDISNDWRATMQRIYRYVGLDFTSGTEDTMLKWLTNSESEGKHSRHRYRLEHFGLEARRVDYRMRYYREHFAIPTETKAARANGR